MKTIKREFEAKNVINNKGEKYTTSGFSADYITSILDKIAKIQYVSGDVSVWFQGSYAFARTDFGENNDTTKQELREFCDIFEVASWREKVLGCTVAKFVFELQIPEVIPESNKLSL